ncbi:uncharacterized protein LOC110463818 [Mizuhopecten yessoensis]|uniref:uncharacterized protein LOC110463818 n=1 Tax=Mizuhopecten yessoensis TaxID=6573 RepID=UPI000B45DA62|nr:uncharacterized protein LOC110463818 [Mizuhopecten yessoensis]
MAITGQGHPPDLVNYGISVPTGFSVNVGLSTTERRRYEGTDDCDIYNTLSSSLECVQLCQAKSLALLCECNHRSTSRGFAGVDRICDVEDLECLQREIRKFIFQDYCSSQCQVPCV